MVPPWAVTKMLIGLAKVLPKAKLVPQDNLADMAFRDMEKKKLVSLSPVMDYIKFHGYSSHAFTKCYLSVFVTHTQHCLNFS